MVLEGLMLVLICPNIDVSRIHKHRHHILYWDLGNIYWKVTTSLSNIPQQSDTKAYIHRY